MYMHTAQSAEGNHRLQLFSFSWATAQNGTDALSTRDFTRNLKEKSSWSFCKANSDFWNRDDYIESAQAIHVNKIAHAGVAIPTESTINTDFKSQSSVEIFIFQIKHELFRPNFLGLIHVRCQ